LQRIRARRGRKARRHRRCCARRARGPPEPRRLDPPPGLAAWTIEPGRRFVL